MIHSSLETFIGCYWSFGASSYSLAACLMSFSPTRSAFWYLRLLLCSHGHLFSCPWTTTVHQLLDTYCFPIFPVSKPCQSTISNYLSWCLLLLVLGHFCSLLRCRYWNGIGLWSHLRSCAASLSLKWWPVRILRIASYSNLQVYKSQLEGFVLNQAVPPDESSSHDFWLGHYQFLSYIAFFRLWPIIVRFFKWFFNILWRRVSCLASGLAIAPQMIVSS